MVIEASLIRCSDGYYFEFFQEGATLRGYSPASGVGPGVTQGAERYQGWNLDVL